MAVNTERYDGVHFQVALMNMTDGSVQGHGAGCADLTRGVKKFSEPEQATDVWDVKSKAEARAYYNADFDEETDGWYEINWLPCAKHVPEVDETEEAPEVADGDRELPDGWDTIPAPSATYADPEHARSNFAHLAEKAETEQARNFWQAKADSIPAPA